MHGCYLEQRPMPFVGLANPHLNLRGADAHLIAVALLSSFLYEEILNTYKSECVDTIIAE